MSLKQEEAVHVLADHYYEALKASEAEAADMDAMLLAIDRRLRDRDALESASLVIAAVRRVVRETLAEAAAEE
jgi:hypothetical protein